MEHPLIVINPTAEEQALLEDVVNTQSLPKTTTIKDLMCEEMFLAHYKSEWEQAHVEFMKTQESVPLSPHLSNVSLSLKAKEQFDAETEEFRLLFVGWFESQLENQMTPYFSGQRIEKIHEQWIYSYGKIKVLASIKKQKVVILAFDKTTNEELLQEMLEEAENSE